MQFLCYCCFNKKRRRVHVEGKMVRAQRGGLCGEQARFGCREVRGRPGDRGAGGSPPHR